MDDVFAVFEIQPFADLFSFLRQLQFIDIHTLIFYQTANFYVRILKYPRMAELADAHDSKS